jgi:hypothetical protein
MHVALGLLLASLFCVNRKCLKEMGVPRPVGFLLNSTESMDLIAWGW